MSSTNDTAEEAAAAAASLSRSRQALQDAAQQLFWDASEVDEAGLACKLAAVTAHSDKLAADLATASATLAAEKQAHSSSTAASAKTIAQLRRSLTTKADSMHLLEGNFQACRSELALTTKQLARTQDEVNELTDEVAELTDVIDENNEFTNNLREEHEELQFRSTDNMDREGPACVQVTKLRETLAEERAEVIRSRACVAELECKLAKAAASQDLWSSLEGGAQGGTEAAAAACKLAGVVVLRGLVEGRVAELECKLGEERGVSEGLRMRLAAAEQALEAEEEEHGNTQGMAKLKWKVALVTRERYEEEFNDYNKEQRDKWNAWHLEFNAYKALHKGPHSPASSPPPLPITEPLPAHLANPPPQPHQAPHAHPPSHTVQHMQDMPPLVRQEPSLAPVPLPLQPTLTPRTAAAPSSPFPATDAAASPSIPPSTSCTSAKPPPFSSSSPPILDATTGVKALRLYLSQSGVPEATMRTMTYKAELLELAVTRRNAWEVRRVGACRAMLSVRGDDCTNGNADGYSSVFRVPESADWFRWGGTVAPSTSQAKMLWDTFEELKLTLHPHSNSLQDAQLAHAAYDFLFQAYMCLPGSGRGFATPPPGADMSYFT
ncbi:MAG: hypothetical protein WDW38_007438 [Sanguina aurantia]